MTDCRGFVFLLCLAAATAGVATADDASRTADFTGSWELDYQRSDRTNTKIRGQYLRAKSEAEREQERARQDRYYHVDSKTANYRAVIGLGRLAEKIAEATLLTISQTPDRVVINREEDFALICDFNAPQPTKTPFGKESCGWRKNQLSFLMILPDGLVVHHLFSIASSRRYLNVATTVRISGVGHPFTLNRVYLPFDPGEGLYDCKYTIAKHKTCTLGHADDTDGSGG